MSDLRTLWIRAFVGLYMGGDVNDGYQALVRLRFEYGATERDPFDYVVERNFFRGVCE